jgi:hypothetical protein
LEVSEDVEDELDEDVVVGVVETALVAATLMETPFICGLRGDCVGRQHLKSQCS